IY
ncbi:hypothetical protein VC95412_001387B, partial [Vibrio cholerae O1 str. 95412]